MSIATLLFAAIAPIVQPAGPFERWHLSFDAKVEGDHVIENYPQYEKLFYCGASVARYYGQPLANWEVKCFDKDGKRVTEAPNASYFYTLVISSKMEKYHDEFITPPGTVKIEIAFNQPNTNENLVVENAKLEKIENPPTRNVNPDFSMGPRGFAGWSVGRNRRIAEDPENPGKYMLVAGGDAGNGNLRSNWIPVVPGEKIRCEYKMRSSLTNGAGRVVFMTYKSTAQRDDCQDGTLSKTFFIGKRMTEGSFDFVVPPEIHVLRVYADNAEIHRMAFTKEGAK
ncbi:MAG: hypothetical protein RBT78_07295 [Kiritimatiellia bacterium]|jgi:hypothetical protein|nr:hypothetical protein [Kiritimatiellia bacterium]